jgi:hypothetical protein
MLMKEASMPKRKKSKREPRTPMLTNRLPATFEQAEYELLEADAIAHVREQVCRIRDEKIEWFGLHFWFEKSDSRRWAKEWIARAAADPDGLIDVCNYARGGWGLAHEVLCDLIIQYRHQRINLPIPLEAYDNEIVRASRDPGYHYRRTRGQQKSDLFLRDIGVVYLVVDVCWKFNLRPTRNPGSQGKWPSGCSVVALAMTEEGLGIDEDTVVAIWEKLGARAHADRLNEVPYPF